MTFWGRYRKDQSFVQYPATKHHVYRSRMEDKAAESSRKPERSIKILEEENEEQAEQAMEKAKGGFWQAIAGIFAAPKNEAPKPKAKWPSNTAMAKK